MDSKNIHVMIEKSKKEGGLRNTLLYRKSDCTPYVVCSNYVNNNGNIDWDWGHYCNNVFTALFILYEYELEDIFDKDEMNFFNWYTRECSNTRHDEIRLDKNQYNLLTALVSNINKLLKRDSANMQIDI